jgi:hypothetical protein
LQDTENDRVRKLLKRKDVKMVERLESLKVGRFGKPHTPGICKNVKGKELQGGQFVSA